MAWQLTNFSAPSDVTQVIVYNDFINAYNQRLKASRAVTGTTYLPLLVSGDSANDSAYFANLQNAIETMCNDGYFVVSYVSGTKLADDYYDDFPYDTGQTQFPTYNSLAEAFDAAGYSPQVTWRRYQNIPPWESGADLSGVAQDGDLYGTWLFEDLQRICKVLCWTQRQVDFLGGQIYQGTGGPNFGTGDDTLAGSLAAAQADWQVVTDYDVLDPSFPLSPTAFGYTEPDSADDGTISYVSLIKNTNQVVKIGTTFTNDVGLPPEIPCDILWYIWVDQKNNNTPQYSQWSEHNDDVVKRAYRRWLTDVNVSGGATPFYEASSRWGTSGYLTETYIPYELLGDWAAGYMGWDTFRYESGNPTPQNTPYQRCLIHWNFSQMDNFLQDGFGQDGFGQ